MCFRVRSFRAASCAAILLVSTPAAAELPPPVRAMIDAAIATCDEAKVATVIDLARQTNPGETAAIDAIEADYRATLAESEKAKAAAEREAIRHAGLFDRWSGKGEIGASYATGNSDNVGLSLGLSLERKGIDWTHKLRATADYQRSNGTTTREQFFAAYEPRYTIEDGLFAYGLAQYERDRFQGFSGRYSLSGGLGYRLIDRDDLSLAVKAGPAWRRTQFVGGGSDESLAALVGLDFDWKITDRLALSQDANATTEAGGEATAFIGGGNTSINLITGLEAKISDKLSARLSYSVEYDSDPPAGAVSTDTLSRLTVVYGF